MTSIATPAEKVNPSSFLGEIIGSNVDVKLHNGVQYSGALLSIDGFMNITLENGKEVCNGSVVNTYPDVFIRGNNGMYFWIHPSLLNLLTSQCCTLVKRQLSSLLGGIAQPSL